MNCQRCGKETTTTTMSWYNEQMICMECDKAEQNRSDIKEAKEADRNAINNGNYNYKGIGL